MRFVMLGAGAIGGVVGGQLELITAMAGSRERPGRYTGRYTLRELRARLSS